MGKRKRKPNRSAKSRSRHGQNAENVNNSKDQSSVVCNNPSSSGTIPDCHLGNKITDGALLDANLNTQNSADPLVLGPKTSNVTSLNVCRDSPMRNDVPQPSSVDSNLQQLTTRVLPPFIPPPLPPSSKSFVSSETYSCLDCGDIFGLKSSLTFHLQRRSVEIIFACDSCNDVQIFFNRCTLLSHIRAHTGKGETSNISKAVVKPLSISEMPLKIPFYQDNCATGDTKESAASLAKIVGVSTSGLSVEETLVLNSAEEAPNVVPCAECGKNFSDSKLKVKHLTNNDQIPMVTSQCQNCGMFCPSKCNFKAHLRIHQRVKPFVCPECGVLLEQSWNTFFKHLKYDCFHFSRSIGYKCCVCKYLLVSSAAHKKHVLDLHTETYMKCSICRWEFRSITDFQCHNDKSGCNVPFQLTFHCPFCIKVFLSEQEMLTHLESHRKHLVEQYVFNCMECNKATDSKVALREHLRIFHSLLKTNVSSSRSDLNTEGGSKEVDDNMTSQSEEVECMLCHCSFMTHQEYTIHKTEAHTYSKENCRVCGLTTKFTRDMVKHGRKHMENKLVVCLLCHNKVFLDGSLLPVHLFNHVATLKFSSCCPLCDVFLPNDEDALSHLKKEHTLENTKDLGRRLCHQPQTPR